MKVYGQFDQTHLDMEYDAWGAAKGFQREEIYRAESEATFARFERIADVVYDISSGAKLDIYPATCGAPLFVWIHGGYWRASSKNDNAFVATGLIPQGIAVANVDYTLAPSTSLDEIVRQVRTALAWLFNNADTYGIDPRRIHIGGHSAGGQLVGMALSSDWLSAFGLPERTIGTALSVSGLFDLEPIRLSYVNEWLGLDPAAAQRNSPIRLIPVRSGARLLTTVGGKETAEFKRQTEIYASAWERAGHPHETIDIPGSHHFDIILALAKAETPLCTALVSSILSDKGGPP
jgi:arylformamidase